MAAGLSNKAFRALAKSGLVSEAEGRYHLRGGSAREGVPGRTAVEQSERLVVSTVEVPAEAVESVARRIGSSAAGELTWRALVKGSGLRTTQLSQVLAGPEFARAGSSYSLTAAGRARLDAR